MVLLAHEPLNSACAVFGSVFTKCQGVTVDARVVLTCKEPLRIDGELAYERHNDVDEDRAVDGPLAILHESLKRGGFRVERCREHVEGVPLFVIDERPNARRDGFNEWLVHRRGGLRGEAGRRKGNRLPRCKFGAHIEESREEPSLGSVADLSYERTTFA